MKLVLTIIAAVWTLTATAADRNGRPMIIHRLPELGLEIWTEQDPQWETRLRKANGVTTFIAETPGQTYPPASMSWTSVPKLTFSDQDIEAVARGALHQVATNHRVKQPEQITIQPQSYGELVGYETVFEADSEQVPIDVRVFCGHRPGRAAVVMQISTLRHKVPHVSEHIRRSWSNVRYLP